MTDTTNYAFFKDSFVPIESANVNIKTHAFMYGTAVFEGIRAYWNDKKKELYVFRLKEHFMRMAESMKIMHLSSKYSTDELCSIVVELLKKNKAQTDIYIRPAVYKIAQRVDPGLHDNPSDICIFVQPFGEYFKNTKALKVQISNWRRAEDNAIPARAKITGSYVNTALAKGDAIMAGFDECIVLSENGHVSEGSAMNLFMVKNNKLVTSATTDNILEGITRGTIIELVKQELGIETICRPIDRSELYTADELFFTGTGAQIAAIGEVDSRVIGDGGEGTVASRIKQAYIEMCRGNLPRYHHWLTPVYTSANETIVKPVDVPARYS